MALSRDDIIAAIAARKAEVERYPVPEWGGDVCIRRLSAADLKELGLLDGGLTRADVVLKLLIACIADDQGEQLLTEEDLQQLSEAEFGVMLRIFGVAAQANGLSSKDLDEAIAAFAGAQPDASSSS